MMKPYTQIIVNISRNHSYSNLTVMSDDKLNHYWNDIIIPKLTTYCQYIDSTVVKDENSFEVINLLPKERCKTVTTAMLFDSIEIGSVIFYTNTYMKSYKVQRLIEIFFGQIYNPYFEFELTTHESCLELDSCEKKALSKSRRLLKEFDELSDNDFDTGDFHKVPISVPSKDNTNCCEKEVSIYKPVIGFRA